jgi:hypothetical protein
MLDTDPLFVNAGANDYSLQAGSPCLDTGDPVLPEDPDGTERDMGAFYRNQVDDLAGEGAIAVSDNALPVRFAIDAAYPNPFNNLATIRYGLPTAGRATIKATDLMGREVASLVDGDMSAGWHLAQWDATWLPTGYYVVTLDAGGVRHSIRMTLIK